MTEENCSNSDGIAVVSQKPDDVMGGDGGAGAGDGNDADSVATTKINGKTDYVGNGCTRKSKQSNSVSRSTKIVTSSKTIAPLCHCTSPGNCVSLKDILNLFKAALSEEQAWALIFQFITLYRKFAATKGRYIFSKMEMPEAIEHLNLHHDGTVHCSLPAAKCGMNDVQNVSRAKSLQEKKKEEEEEEEATEAEDEGAEDQGYENYALMTASHKMILRKVAVIIYTALDFNMPTDEQCQMSNELEELISAMTEDESDDERFDDDEGIDQDYKHWDDDERTIETKEFDYILETCRNHIKPTVPEDHYKAVCRALATETIELRVFLQHVLSEDADNLKADSETSKLELAKLGFSDWARFWVSCIDELRRGVRLKKSNYSRAPTEFELTPYEILMEDIRSKNYQLRKVMVNGDIPPRVKKDAQALILEFIRSRPPLKKASERKLPPPMPRTPSPREQLMDSIRKGQTLKHIATPTAPLRIKDRLLPTAATASTKLPSSNLASTIPRARHTLGALTLQENMEPQTTPRSKQRLIKVDFRLLQDDDALFDGTITVQHAANPSSMGICSQPKMPPYPIGGYMVSEPNTNTNTKESSTTTTTTNTTNTTTQIPAAVATRVLRRTTYDLATQCESRRASLRRHTIVGCQSNLDETHSMPPSRPASRQADVNAIDVSAPKQLHNNFNQHQQQQQQQQQQKQMKCLQNPNSLECTGADRAGNNNQINGPWNKSFLDEKTWHERGDDRLSLTLEEIVHIRSVMTKAELEGLPVDVRIKEDVEKRKVCFLCLRTRFSIFGPWGIPCKLCQRTVCSKCYTKMRIPSEHFRKVPLVLISPSLLSSPAGSNTPSPSHHAHHVHSSSTGNILDETFPKSLIERLLRSESETRNTVGSAPSSPKHQRSNMSTPGAGHTVEGVHEVAATISNSYYKASAHNKPISNMSRSMEGPHSLPVQVSPARPHSNSSTLDRKSKFARTFMMYSSSTHLSQEQKENMRGEQVPVCNDCKGLVMEITRSSKQTRSSARNRALQSLTLDLSPVYK